jgi:hypothetical protein
VFDDDPGADPDAGADVEAASLLPLPLDGEDDGEDSFFSVVELSFGALGADPESDEPVFPPP